MPPANFGSIESPFGVLVNMPFACLALALPVAWRRGALPDPVRPLAVALAACIVPTTAVLCLFYGTSNRYQLEITPGLMLGAGLATLALIAAGGPRQRTLRWAGIVLAAMSVLFNVLAAAKYRGELDGMRGVSLLADNRPAEAVPVLESAVRLSPGMTTSRMALAIGYAATGRSADASAQVSGSLQRDPGRADAIYQNYGPTLMQLNREEDVEAILAATLLLHPGNAGLHNDRGAVLARLGRGDDALKEFNEALRLEPENADALTNLGVLAMRAGRMSEARGYLERALRSNPQQSNARELLQRLPQPGP